MKIFNMYLKYELKWWFPPMVGRALVFESLSPGEHDVT